MMYSTRHRGAAFLEFVLILPFLVAILMMTVDVGRTVLAVGGLQDAAAAAARAAARVGYAGSIPSGEPCISPGTNQDIAYNAFCQAVGGLPVGDVSALTVLEPKAVTVLGQTCVAGDPESEFISVLATTELNLVTPAIDRLIGGAGSRPGTVALTATAVSRCEVAR